MRSSASFLAISDGSQSAHFGRGLLAGLFHAQAFPLDHLLGAQNLLLGGVVLGLRA